MAIPPCHPARQWRNYEKFSLLMGNPLETEIIVGCFLVGWINALYLDEKLQALVAWNWHLMA